MELIRAPANLSIPTRTLNLGKCINVLKKFILTRKHVLVIHLLEWEDLHSSSFGVVLDLEPNATQRPRSSRTSAAWMVLGDSYEIRNKDKIATVQCKSITDSYSE